MKIFSSMSMFPRCVPAARTLPAVFMRGIVRRIIVWAGAWLLTGCLASAGVPKLLDDYDPIFTTPSADSRGSMPLGNGDIALNAWVEPNGDLCFFIARNNAWGDDLTSPSYGAYGLLKVGKIRVSLLPSPFAAGPAFHQQLHYRNGMLEVTGGNAKLRVWVDANLPVIRVETSGHAPAQLTVKLESWRKTPTAYLGTDTIVNPPANSITWYYRNRNTEIPMLINRTIGASVEGKGLISKNSETLQSQAPAVAWHVRVHPLTAQETTPENWLSHLRQQVAATDAIPEDKAWIAHETWWRQFWERSYIFITGGSRSREVTAGYLGQRFTDACTSRGEFPIKFNGSLFVVDSPYPKIKKDKSGAVLSEQPVTADYRVWGYQYWFQNTRPMYWAMLASGDFDLMQPLFRMYTSILKSNAAQVKEFYGHGGSYIRETAPPWGGLIKITPQEGGNYTKHYFTPVLELSAMMLEYYAYTQDDDFARNTLIPTADAGLTFFSEHFPRKDGHLFLNVANAIEMYWKVQNPMPDIAGLHWVLQELHRLPQNLTSPEMRARWAKLEAELPPIPIGQRNGKPQLLPCEEGQTLRGHNQENPELYAIYPFRLYGLGKPDFEVAMNAFANRKFKGGGCWRQDPVQSALMGDVRLAQTYTTTDLLRRDGKSRFPAFWTAGFDYAPDEDNGGNGKLALQSMLLQNGGDKVIILPAWPPEWDVTFRLFGPNHTIVDAQVAGGKLVRIETTPPNHRAMLEPGSGWTLPPESK